MGKNEAEVRKMKIRRGKASDLERLYHLLNKTPELAVGEKVKITYDREWVRNVLSKNRTNLVLIVEENKKIIAFLISHYLLDVKQAILNDIYVKPNYRKKGLASKLFNTYQNIIKKLGINLIIALVLTNNRKIQKFNEKYGFKKGNKFYFYYKKIK